VRALTRRSKILRSTERTDPGGRQRNRLDYGRPAGRVAKATIDVPPYPVPERDAAPVLQIWAALNANYGIGRHSLVQGVFVMRFVVSGKSLWQTGKSAVQDQQLTPLICVDNGL